MAGTLYIVGGGMNRGEEEIVSAFIASAGGPAAKFAFVVSASGDDPDGTFRSYVDDFARLGVERQNCVLIPLYAMHVKDERGFNAYNGDEESLPALLEGVTGVWFSGGDQYHTAQCFLRPDGTYTRALEILHEIYQKGGAIGGSSAGAAIMSHVMIGGGNNRGTLYHDTVFGYDTYEEIDEKDDPAAPLILARGLGFFPQGVVDQHFNKRPRLLRSIEACLANREGIRVGFAVSEDTALVYNNGHISVLGSAGVYIIDCRNAVKTGNGCYDGVVLHAIHKGDSLDEKTGEILLAGDCRGGKPRYVSCDYVSGGIIDSPAFDSFIDINLLQARDDCMYFCEKRNMRYAKGIVAYEAHEKTYAVVLKYFRGDKTRGYRSAHTSFADVELAVRTREIQL
ncbi:MAG TPA: cyanophycinase [Firmicutes bacterium]|nr:cyanophycinase [Candidatus Fermentithermobacillaceae bacterium]